MKVSCGKSEMISGVCLSLVAYKLLIKANDICVIITWNLKLFEVFPFLVRPKREILKLIISKLTRFSESCVNLADKESRSLASRQILRAKSLSSPPIR
jgi:hypothetical protein